MTELLPRRPVAEADLGRVAVRYTIRGSASNVDVDYRSLWARVDELRPVIAALPPAAVVGIRIGNEPALLVAFLACLEARRPAVFFDPLWKEAELRHAAGLVDVALLFESETTPRAESGAIFSASVGELDDRGVLRVAPGPVPEKPARRVRGIDVSDIAAIHWSSGSTGLPLPIPVTHAGLVHRADSRARSYPFDASSKTLCALPLSHCHGIEYLALPTLAAGGELVLMDPMTADPASMVHVIRERGITVVSALPRFYAQLVDLAVEPAALASVRMPMCGSAALHPDVSRRFAERFGRRIGQCYGLTEIGLVTLNQHRDPPLRFDSVGQVLHGIEWRIDEPDADGIGELWLRSPGCAIDDGDGWLRTRDLVRADGDGYLYVAGRRSSFINVNGAKADPVEIERVVEVLPWVAECAVRGFHDARGVERIAAYVVPRPQRAPRAPAEEVQRCVAETLSIFKIPARVVQLDALPRTSLGKVAYASLPWPGEVAPVAPDVARMPRGEVERSVAELWCEVLGLERVGVDQSFLRLGGTSVQQAQLLIKLQERFRADVSIVDLYRHPTVEAQAAFLRPGADRPDDAVRAGLERGREQRAALAQRRPPSEGEPS